MLAPKDAIKNTFGVIRFEMSVGCQSRLALRCQVRQQYVANYIITCK